MLSGFLNVQVNYRHKFIKRNKPRSCCSFSSLLLNGLYFGKVLAVCGLCHATFHLFQPPLPSFMWKRDAGGWWWGGGGSQWSSLTHELLQGHREKQSTRCWLKHKYYLKVTVTELCIIINAPPAQPRYFTHSPHRSPHLTLKHWLFHHRRRSPWRVKAPGCGPIPTLTVLYFTTRRTFTGCTCSSPDFQG